MRVFMGVLAVALLASGCARMVVKRATSDDELGVRFYSPEPYLFRTPAKDGGCTVAIVYLPNKDERWVARVHPGFGSVNASATLTDGWNLTAFGQQVDSKVPETIEALAGAAKVGVGVTKPPAAACGPILEKLEWQDGAWKAPR